MMNNTNNPQSDSYKDVFISFNLDAKSNEYLSESAKRANRTKRQEAQIRLRDHLANFSSISEISKAIER